MISVDAKKTAAKVDIVMFNMSAYSEWQSGFVNRNSHILHGLLNHPNVRKIVSIDYLPFTLKRAVKVLVQNILRGPQGKLMHWCPHTRVTAISNWEINKTIFKTTGSAQEVSYKLFVLSSYLSYFSENLMMAELRRQIKKLNLKNIIIWSYLPTFTKYLDILPARVKVFDAVDNWLEHSAYQKIKERLKNNYKYIAKNADLIFTTAEELVKFFGRGQDIYYLPNGVRWEEFAQIPKLVNRDIATLPRPIIGYVGIIQQDRIDLDLIAYLARENPKKSIVLVGPVWANFRQQVKDKLRAYNNIYFLGRKHYEEVPSYINQFDLAIVPHLVNDFGKYTSLLKIFEYLALGKPVVTTPTAGTDKLGNLIKIADTAEKFNQAIIEELAQDNEQLRLQRREFAREQSWQSRLAFMMDKILAKL